MTYLTYGGNIPFALQRMTQPDFEPVTLAEARLHLRIPSAVTESDNQISALITAAREWAEDYTGRSIIDQVWKLNLGNNFQIDTVSDIQPVYSGWTDFRNGIYLHRSPVLSILSVVTLDADGAETTVDGDDYQLLDFGGKWPRLLAGGATSWIGGRSSILFRAGFIDTFSSPPTGTVPKVLTQAMLLYIEAMYDRDKDMMEKLLDIAERIARPERCNLQVA